ncbi:uroporphyrinogen-III synthase [Sphingomonas sp. PAMC 26617]|uniref:uroporphyrinogen-III synthase n=1 Tax=Sphingomonas sp. PAMC 26617 TaxID=1112216 RepID=UPI000289EAC9|nr:uroporphyrinogen-III synthase [Sphingomonas sp. PAMC 26617]
MTLRLVVLRPEPGNAATCARAEAAGFEAMALPLFAVEPLDWTVPDTAPHDALILTSANSLRFGGDGLAALRSLPVIAVGAHTAAAARDYGFDVMATGSGNAADILALAAHHGIARALHLTGHDRTLEAGGVIATLIPVYRSAAVPVEPFALAVLDHGVALLHSARAAKRIAALVDAAETRATIALAAFSPAIAAAAGVGWRAIVTAATPDDAALFAALAPLAPTKR